jgi:hypothetical protein
MGSAVDQEIHEDGVVFARLRPRPEGRRSVAGLLRVVDRRDAPELVTEDVATDPHAWAQANPGLGIRITSSTWRTSSGRWIRRTFAVERLGVGDWPSTDPDAGTKIDREAWDKLLDMKSSASGSGVSSRST